MANRHLGRSIVLQTLFEWDFRGFDKKETDKILERNVAEFGPGLGASGDFTAGLLKTVFGKIKDIDDIISKAAPDWPIEKISNVDRNVLRIGLAELLFSDRKEVPAKVAINEAIELAKTFGGENSGKFVNGVLGSIYKEIGEPGKDEESSKDKVTLQKLGGAVVYAKDKKGGIYLAFVHDVFGHWTLSKGKIEESENEEEATLREVGEELGLKKLKVTIKLGENEYLASHPEKGKLLKHVTYFLVESKYENIKLEEKGGLDDAQWFKLADIADLNFYGDILPIITKAVNMLVGSGTSSEKLES